MRKAPHCVRPQPPYPPLREGGLPPRACQARPPVRRHFVCLTLASSGYPLLALASRFVSCSLPLHAESMEWLWGGSPLPTSPCASYFCDINRKVCLGRALVKKWLHWRSAACVVLAQSHIYLICLGRCTCRYCVSPWPSHMCLAFKSVSMETSGFLTYLPVFPNKCRHVRKKCFHGNTCFHTIACSETLFGKQCFQQRAWKHFGKHVHPVYGHS